MLFRYVERSPMRGWTKVIVKKCNSYSPHNPFTTHYVCRILEKPECNLLGNISSAERSDARDTMVRMILDTDPLRHYDLISNFTKHLEKHTLTSEALVTILLHIADVSNPVRPQTIATYWACAVEKWFLRQGDEEK